MKNKNMAVNKISSIFLFFMLLGFESIHHGLACYLPGADGNQKNISFVDFRFGYNPDKLLKDKYPYVIRVSNLTTTLGADLLQRFQNVFGEDRITNISGGGGDLQLEFNILLKEVEIPRTKIKIINILENDFNICSHHLDKVDFSTPPKSPSPNLTFFRALMEDNESDEPKNPLLFLTAGRGTKLLSLADGQVEKIGEIVFSLPTSSKILNKLQQQLPPTAKSTFKIQIIGGDIKNKCSFDQFSDYDLQYVRVDNCSYDFRDIFHGQVFDTIVMKSGLCFCELGGKDGKSCGGISASNLLAFLNNLARIINPDNPRAFAVLSGRNFRTFDESWHAIIRTFNDINKNLSAELIFDELHIFQGILILKK